MGDPDGRVEYGTSQGALFAEEAATESDRLRAQLSAVELLLAHRDRDVAHHDILLATIFEILASGPRSGSDIAEQVRTVWPLRLLNVHVESALAAAADMQLVRQEPRDGASATWHLLDAGRAHLDEAVLRAADLDSRFQQQVLDQVRDQGIPLDQTECAALVGLVISALRAGIGDCFRGMGDDRVEHVGGWLRVVQPDLDRVGDFVDRRVPDADRADLVKALVNMAFNQAAHLGNEVVHHLIAGHLLYVFMGRPDRSAAAAAAGSLTRERLLLDTPILLQLLGPSERRQPMLDLLAAAKGAGMDVTVQERTCVELERLLDGAERYLVPGVEKELGRADPQVLTGIYRSDEVIWNWLTWAHSHQSDRPDISWKSWRSGDHGPAQLFRTLKAMGIPVSTSQWEIGDSHDFDRFKVQLEAQLKDGPRTRSDRVLTHDAGNLVDLHRARRANPAGVGKVWPGAFVLTPDTQLSSAYESVVGVQTLPAALTFSQAAQIIGAYADPRRGEQLAFDVASGVAEQVLLARAANIPPDLARQLVAATATEPVSSLEVEQMQLDLRRAFDTSRAALEGGSADHQQIVDQVTRQMRTRRDKVRQQAHDVAQDERVRRAGVDARRDERLRSKDEDNRALSSENELLAAKLSETEEVLAAAKNRGKTQEDIQKRQRRAERLAFVVALGVVVLFMSGKEWSAVSMFITAICTFIYGREWASRRVSLGVALLGVVGLVSSIYPLIPKDEGSPAVPPAESPEGVVTP